jgi:hypothetical protein
MGDSSQAVRRSGRSGAGTHPSRKRANSQLLRQAHPGVTTLSASTTKRRRRIPTLRSSPPLESLQQQEEEEEKEEEEEDKQADRSTSEEVDDDTEELSWRGSWKAVVNRKIDLPRSQLGIWTADSLLEETLTEWRIDSMIVYRGTLQLIYSWLEAIVTHDKARAKVDTASIDLRDSDLLEELYRTLSKDIEQGKRPILNLIYHFDRVEPTP